MKIFLYSEIKVWQPYKVQLPHPFHHIMYPHKYSVYYSHISSTATEIRKHRYSVHMRHTSSSQHACVCVYLHIYLLLVLPLCDRQHFIIWVIMNEWWHVYTYKVAIKYAVQCACFVYLHRFICKSFISCRQKSFSSSFVYTMIVL